LSGYLAQQILNGLILGSMYALVAIGFSMIYGMVRLINFAHGDVAMIGAFTAFALIGYTGLPLWAVLLAAMAAGALMGVAIELTAFRPLRGAPQVNGFITSLGVSILIQNAGILLLSAQPRPFNLPGGLRGQVDLGFARASMLDLAILLVSVLLMAGLTVFVGRSRLGMAMRATAENPDVARLMGIAIDRVVLAAFVIGGGLAGLAGLMWGGRYGQIDPLLGFVPGLKAFVAAVIGGVGSVPGAMLGGYLLGMAEVLFVGLLPPQYASFRDAFVFALLILILLVLPNGLLGRPEEERA
jgi:branched-chain amino acid transport system permease protein